MNVTLKPVAETEETITFAKEALTAYLEDMADRAAAEQHLALREALGDAGFVRQTYTNAEVSSKPSPRRCACRWHTSLIEAHDP